MLAEDRSADANQMLEELYEEFLPGSDWGLDADAEYDYPGGPDAFRSSYLEAYEAAKAADEDYWATDLSFEPSTAEAASGASSSEALESLAETSKHHRKLQQLVNPFPPMIDAIVDLFTPGTPPASPAPSRPAAPTPSPVPAAPAKPARPPGKNPPASPSPAPVVTPAAVTNVTAVNSTVNSTTLVPPKNGVVLPNGTNATTLDVPLKDVNSSVKLIPSKQEEKEVMQKLEQQVAEAQAANRAQLVKVQMDLIGESDRWGGTGGVGWGLGGEGAGQG